MALLSFEVDTSGLEFTLDALDRGIDEDVLADGAQQILLNRILARFRHEVDPDGNPWIPSHAALREHRATLYRSGRLYRSILPYTEPDGTRTIESRGVPYAMKHNNGIGQVQRRFLGFDTRGEDQRAALEFIEGRIDDLITRIGA